MTKNNSKKGFTLVELSIVLVIIGLLIGGILVAQSMISTTKLQSTVRQLGQFDAAVANFYTKFNQLPGDTSVMGTTTGDNNGFIANAAGTTAPTALAGEVGKFWFDLSTSGLKPTGTAATYTDCSAPATAGCSDAAATAGALVNTEIPAMSIGTNVGAIAFGSAVGSNYYQLSSFSTTITTGALAESETNALKGAEGAAIDAKIDDGVATTGSVIGTTGLFSTTGTAYNAATQTPTTNLSVRIGLQTGLLQ